MIRFRHLNTKHLDLEFTLKAAGNLRIVERPGVWMAERQAADTLAELRFVVERCLGQAPLEYGILSGEMTPLQRAILTVLYEGETGRPIGFSAMSLLDVELEGRRVDVVHLGLGMIDPAFRGRGLACLLYGPTFLLLLARNRLRPLWISNVTQVPSVVGKVAHALSNVYPTADPKNTPSAAHLAIARHIMHHHRSVFGVADAAGFDEARFIITNAYTGGSDNLKKTFVEAPKHRDESFNAMCDAQLDYARGDDFLQIGQFDLRAAGDYLLGLMPRVSLSALAFRPSRGLHGSLRTGPTGHLRP